VAPKTFLTRLLRSLGVIRITALKPIPLLFKSAEDFTRLTHVTLARRPQALKILLPSAPPTLLLRILRAQAIYTAGVSATHFSNRKPDCYSDCGHRRPDQRFRCILLRKFNPSLTRPTSSGAPFDCTSRRCTTFTSCSSAC
jgi:hypothetical protein